MSIVLRLRKLNYINYNNDGRMRIVGNFLGNHWERMEKEESPGIEHRHDKRCEILRCIFVGGGL